MNISVGNRVKFINEELDGEIKAVLSDKKLIVSCSYGFDYDVLFSEVIIVVENNDLNYSMNESDISEKLNSAAIFCMISEDKPSASGNTANWFPPKIVSVKTSTV